MSLFGYFRPCAPPSVVSSFVFQCKHGWADNTASFMVRLFNAFCYAWVWHVLAAVVVATMAEIIIYQVVMIELWINGNEM